jgi:hypothetical protein
MPEHKHIIEDIIFEGVVVLRKVEELKFVSLTSDVGFRQTEGKIQFRHEGGEWGDLVKITVGTTPPESPAVGDLWVDTN